MMDGMVLTVLWAVVIANSSRYKLSIIQIHPILPYLYLLVPLIYVTAGILNIVAANRQNPKLITAFRVFKFVTFQASLIFSIMHGVDTFEVAGRRGVFPVDVLSFLPVSLPHVHHGISCAPEVFPLVVSVDLPAFLFGSLYRTDKNHVLADDLLMVN
ncbi:PREDICTED: uncharacterized protein LOC106147021 isoform X4 [Chinchilla lanigera]|nr:PREDICTED: uncharacterized protein LOC106147021 isoform X4 [Chinchilla lanigera]